MAVVVRVDDYLGIRSPTPDRQSGAAEVETAAAPPTEPPIPETEIEFTDLDLPPDPAVLRKLWVVLLLMAVRDHASSVHYQPWRADGALAYILNGTRHVLVPPSANVAGSVVAAARSLAKPGWRGLLARLAWWLGGAAAGRFILDIDGSCVEWDVVCWSADGRVGVDFFRVSPPDADMAPQPSQEAAS